MCKYGPLKKGKSYKKHEKSLASLVGDYRVADWPDVSAAVGQPVMVRVTVAEVAPLEVSVQVVCVAGLTLAPPSPCRWSLRN